MPIFHQFPYGNTHDQNYDWILETIKGFIDKYNGINEELDRALQAILDAKNRSLEELRTAISVGLDAVSLAISTGKADALSAIATDKADALSAIAQDYTDAHEAILSEKSDALDAIYTDKSDALTEIDAEKTDAVSVISAQETSTIYEIQLARQYALEELQVKLEQCYTALSIQESDLISRVTTLIETLPDDSQAILGLLNIILSILNTNWVYTAVWNQGYYSGDIGINFNNDTTYLSTSEVSSGGVAGRRIKIHCEPGYIINEISIWTSDESPQTRDTITITDQHDMDFDFPLYTKLFSITIRKSDSSVITASDVQGNVTVEWPMNAVEVPNMIAYIESSNTASRAHEVGTTSEFFMYNGSLYHATEDIAQYDTIITSGIGQNAEVILVMDYVGGIPQEMAELTSEVNSLKNLISQVYNYDSDNLLNEGELTENYFYNHNGVRAQDTNFSYFELTVVPGTTYNFQTEARFVTDYDGSTIEQGLQRVYSFTAIGTKAYVTFNNNARSNWKIAVEDTPLDTVYPYGQKIIVTDNISKRLNKVEEVSELTDKVIGRNNNMLYGHDMIAGYQWITGRGLQENSGRNCFMNIPVVAGVTYHTGVNFRLWYITRQEATSETTTSAGGSNTAGNEFTPSISGFVQITFYASDSPALYSLYEGEANGIFPYNKTPLTENTQLPDSAYEGNILYKKKWAVCGDSFSAGVNNTKISNGLYQGKKIVYPYLIGNRNMMEIIPFFEGGQTLAMPTNAQEIGFTNSLTCEDGNHYYQTIPKGVDYITIYLGINDAHRSTISLGTIDDTSINTYCGALNTVLKWLIEYRGKSHIGLIVTNGIANDNDYRLAQIAIAKKYGIAYIDLNGDARTPAMLRTSNPDISEDVKDILYDKWVAEDGTHPNDDAHIYESTFIEEFLRSI